MACLPTATYSAPGVSLYAALGGGGGGGVTPAGISTNQVTNATGSKLTLTADPTIGIALDTGTSSIQISAPSVLINGSAQIVSTFTVSCPANTSTLITELPPGQWGYNGVNLYSGSLTVLQGFASCLFDSGTENYYGSLIANSNSQPASTNPNAEMTLNFGDSPASTIKLICANNSSGAAVWVGGIGKLY